MTQRKIRRLLGFLALTVSASTVSVWGEEMAEREARAPIATQWVLDAVGPEGRTAVKSVYMIVCPNTASKGSGFLVDNGAIVTNEHVIHGCAAGEIVAVSSFGDRVGFSSLKVDAERDLAALIPSKPLQGGLRLAKTSQIDVGSVVRTWGYPLGYNGPAPLLSVGYLSGFRVQQAEKGRPVKHLVVNAAFNSGNSGGPLFAKTENEVVGVVVNKALPLFTPFVQLAIQAFANNKSGVVFSGTGADGKPIQMVESQLVAEIVASLRDMAQVMIGEAIAVEELAAFVGYKHTSSRAPQPDR